MGETRDHGGNLDAQIARYGGTRETWIDLSTGINPVPYPLPAFTPDCWTALPDSSAQTGLAEAARHFWNVPAGLDILATPGASALISRMPSLFAGNTVDIPQPTYNEHAAAFESQGWSVADSQDLRVLVHPNNPTGHFWSLDDLTTKATVIDESFCDIAPERSLMASALDGDRVILKSFGKFWGLAGLRLGFMIARPDLIAKMRDHIGPWAVSGPALTVGTEALSDSDWARTTRERLAKDADRLDQLLTAKGARIAGGCSLFRLYEVENAEATQTQLAENHIWSRIFPYSKTYIRLGLPAPDRWDKLEAAIHTSCS